MNKKFKKIMSVILCAVLLFTTASVAFAAEETRKVIDSGYCGAEGENLTWTLYDDGELVISGEGEITSAPWRSYEKKIVFITLQEGVTSIAPNAFSFSNPVYCKISLPQSLKYIRGDLIANRVYYSSDRKQFIAICYAGTEEQWSNVSGKDIRLREGHVELFFNGQEPEPFCNIVLKSGLGGNNHQGPIVSGGMGDLYLGYYYIPSPGCKIEWSIEGKTGRLREKEDAAGMVTGAKVSWLTMGWSTVTVKIIDANGNVIATDELMLGAITEYNVKDNMGLILWGGGMTGFMLVMSIISIVFLPVTGPLGIIISLFRG